MKKKVIALFIGFLTILAAPLIYADQPIVYEKIAQKDDEPQIVVIVNQPDDQLADVQPDDQVSEQDLSAEGQNSSTGEVEDPSEEATLSAESSDNEDIAFLKEEDGPKFDVPMTLNQKVEAHLHYFTNGMRKRFREWLARSEKYLPMMKKTFREKGLPEDLTYIALIESGFNSKAYSRAHAVGQWQFIKGTGKKYGLRIDRWIDERRDPEKATEAAAQYLSDLYVMFNDWYLAAASYNAGEGKIMRAIDKYDTNDFWQLSQPQHRYLKRETKDYVPKFIAATLIAKEPEKFGFDDIEYHPPLQYEKVKIGRMVDLRKLARESNCDLEEFRLLNPELKTHYTPANYPNYELKVSADKKGIIEGKLPYINTVPEWVALKEVGPERVKRTRKYRKHKASSKKVISYIVRDGDTLRSIAARYKIDAKRLASWNKLNGHKLKKGKKLKIYVVRKSSRKFS